MDPDAKEIISRVNEAKQSNQAADALIADYMPFIRSETAKYLKRAPEQSDDELSIAMFAFYEAIRSYSRLRGAFLNFAALQIRNRLIDYYRKEKRNNANISLDAASDDEDKPALADTLQDPDNIYEKHEIRDATRQEIAELSAQMEQFGVTMNDIADNAPKQTRTLECCQAAVCYARQHPELLDDFLHTKRIPLAKLAEGAAVERKTLERHRRYLVAVLLICTNGYEILRGHIRQVLNRGE